MRPPTLPLLAAAALAARAEAQVLEYYTELTAEQAGSTEPGSGHGTFVIDTAANTCAYHIEIAGMVNPESAAHIHGPAEPYDEAGIAHFLPLGSPKVGVWDYPEGIEADLLAGLYYVNVHSHEVLSGEMRGQIVPAPLRYCGCASGGPCGNDDAGGGCANSTGQGARVEHEGLPSVLLDSFSPRAEHLPPGQFGLFYVGPGAVDLPFGDGRRCVGGGTLRLTLTTADASGTLVQPPGIVAQTGGAIDAGETWYTQCWYRDPTGPCGGTFNLSDALAVAFTP